VMSTARYRIDPERSRVWIDARSNVHPIHSETAGLEGYVELDLGSDGMDPLERPEGKLSLPVDRLTSNNKMEDRELYRRIDARRFPTIDGVIDQVERSGDDGRYRVAGNITFRGVTKRHEEQMTISTMDEETIKLEGSSRFDIREFGMEPPRVLILKVEPEVDVRVEILAVREG
jgi:polyisoprenoid-binding protein YceI